LNCNGCSVTTLTFDIRLSDELNLSIIPIAIDHLERQGLDVLQQDNRLRMGEFAAREFLSFCQDLLETDLAEFRINQQSYQPISEMHQVFDMEWIDDVIQNERIISHFQPIVDATGNVYAYEMLARFHNADGQMIYPNAIFPAAKSRGRLYALDQVCRMTAVRAAAKLSGEKAFINFIPTSIYSPEFCLRSTIELAHETGVDPKQLVFEVVESEKVDDLEHLKRILGYYKSKGFQYALDRVCRMTAVRAAAKLSGEKAFINFIPTSIYSPEFCLRSTIELAHETGVDPKQLVFEVVESEKVDDLEHLKRILGYYKSKGFQYALDDVGEGYSTAEVLDELRPHYMKLDMQYVQGVATDTAKQAVAQSFLKKAQGVGSTPLAEGIENEEDFQWLKAQGYELFQGYYFGKPAPAPLAYKTV
jgi:EAL domain-containing protein (putative c-di-GMP-specific phosphodiesterase class I)